ncbi:MAG: asparagine synthase (glutamine-hydrolyzing) [Actinobacteria bacterium]|nr:asparagine synthase (glutamine-hydrolyzing) [Actinomycetota bacterium]
MVNSLRHRGPDDSGVWMNPDRKIALGHSRLSIIDLSKAGSQPMSDDSGKIHLIYNGEVYNFMEIRKDLEKKGYRFKSNTDTEVVLYAYKEWGTACLDRFNGMFAFGIYDDRKKQIFIARDRVGKKPLYYAQYKGKFVFSSELKSILCDPEFPHEMDYRALNFYLTFGYISFDFTIFKYARKLPPAHMMVYDINSSRTSISPYWHVPESDGKKYREEELLEELEYLLRDAVRLRMVSDVPLGAFLSGGLDSSLIVAMMSGIAGKNVKTYSIGFKDKKYNELPYAKIVADYFGTDHTEFIVNPEKFNIIDELIGHFDEPFADSSLIPTYYVSKMTRNYVEVALSGDGGDELFGGYSTYIATLGNYYINKFIPSAFRKIVSRSAGRMSDKSSIKKQLLRLKYNTWEAFIDRTSHAYFKDEYRKELLNDKTFNILSDKYYEPEKIFTGILSNSSRDFVNTLEYAHFLSFLPEDILTKVDRMSMKVSLEVRCPILDYRIVEFAFKKLNGNFKIRGMTRKYILKKLAKKILPPELSLNRKWGFAVPISNWFRGDLNPYINANLLAGDNEFFNKGYIKRLLDEHKGGIDHGGRLFTVLVFYLWCKRMKISI